MKLRTDVDNSHTIKAWLGSNLKALYFLAILLGGSTFTAVKICNSNLFYFNVFNMGLTNRQKSLFKNKRLFSTVLLEVR